MLRGLGRPRLLLGTGRWASVLTATLVLVQLDPASRVAAALVGAMASGLGGSPAREAEPPSQSPGGESSESEESLVGRGKEPKPAKGRGGDDGPGPRGSRRDEPRRRAALSVVARDAFPAGGRALRQLLHSYRC